MKLQPEWKGEKLIQANYFNLHEYMEILLTKISPVKMIAHFKNSENKQENTFNINRV